MERLLAREGDLRRRPGLQPGDVTGQPEGPLRGHAEPLAGSAHGDLEDVQQSVVEEATGGDGHAGAHPRAVGGEDAPREDLPLGAVVVPHRHRDRPPQRRPGGGGEIGGPADPVLEPGAGGRDRGRVMAHPRQHDEGEVLHLVVHPGQAEVDGPRRAGEGRPGGGGHVRGQAEVVGEEVGGADGDDAQTGGCAADTVGDRAHRAVPARGDDDLGPRRHGGLRLGSSGLGARRQVHRRLRPAGRPRRRGDLVECSLPTPLRGVDDERGPHCDAAVRESSKTTIDPP